MTLGPILALRSVDVGLTDVPAAELFFTETWHLRVAARQGDAVYLRGSGADHHLLALHPHPRSELLSVTLRAASVSALDQLASQCAAHGARVLASRHAVTEPGGGEAVRVRDPQGRILRFVADDERHADTQERRDMPIRLAHAVLNSHDVGAALPFYESALGLRLSDRTRIMAFVRIPQDGAGDHHSLALADADNDCLNHVAFLMADVDAVMRGGGRMKDAGYPIQWGPGRHGPGDNAFNYFVGPGGLVIEYTSDVEQIDEHYRVGSPDDWKWPAGRVDQWGIGAPPSQTLKQAQRQIAFARAD